MILARCDASDLPPTSSSMYAMPGCIEGCTEKPVDERVANIGKLAGERDPFRLGRLRSAVRD